MSKLRINVYRYGLPRWAYEPICWIISHAWVDVSKGNGALEYTWCTRCGSLR